mmetsp:Transcript_17314/g.31201  ORF Transcript_17314/g.31201 Transcript_17314/m.31201 type:complete len:145 (+) Transcript_17314:1-435(+)
MEAEKCALYAELSSLTAKYFTELQDIFASAANNLPFKRSASPVASKQEAAKEKKDKKWHKTGYYLFTESKKAELKQIPEYEKLKMTEMSKIVSAKWNELTKVEKNVWTAKADKLREEEGSQTRREGGFDWSSDSEVKKRPKVQS